jgi:methionyl-tRNA formyltransferase
MILEILKKQPTPQPQVGDVVNFDRRKPDESRIDWHMEPNQLFDHIRMLDADYYPRAFAEINNYSLEFSDVSQEEGRLIAKVKIINRGVISEQ